MKIIVYGKESCSFCNKAKQLLESKNLPYTYIDVLKDINYAELLELKTKFNMNTVPMIVINDELIGGYTDLAKLDLPNK